MAHARVHAAAIRIMFADDDVVDADQRREDAHRGDEPKRTVARDSKGEADDVRFAGAPIAIKNRRRAWRVHVARTVRADRNHTAPINSVRESWSPRRAALEDALSFAGEVS